jgi:hypothetical protein
VQGIDEDEIKAEHGHESSHLGVRDSEHGSEHVLRPLDLAMWLVVRRANGSVQVRGLEERKSSESVHGRWRCRQKSNEAR